MPGLVWHPLGAKGPVRSRKPCKGKGRKAGLRRSGEERLRMKDFPRDHGADGNLQPPLQLGEAGRRITLTPT